MSEFQHCFCSTTADEPPMLIKRAWSVGVLCTNRESEFFILLENEINCDIEAKLVVLSNGSIINYEQMSQVCQIAQCIVVRGVLINMELPKQCPSVIAEIKSKGFQLAINIVEKDENSENETIPISYSVHNEEHCCACSCMSKMKFEIRN